MGRDDAQQFFEEPPEAVVSDVEGKQPRRPDSETRADVEQDADADQVVDELVEKGRMESRVAEVLGHAVLEVDLQAPRQAGRLAVELLVEVVAPAADSLREQESRRDRVHEQVDARPRSVDDPSADNGAQKDPAPDTEPALP